MWHRRVVVDLKAGRHTGECDTTTNLIIDNLTTPTKKQQLEIVKTYRYPKRHGGRFRKGRRQTPIYRGSICSSIGGTDRSGTINKV